MSLVADAKPVVILDAVVNAPELPDEDELEQRLMINANPINPPIKTTFLLMTENFIKTPVGY
jgi:hypothetical protein